MKKNIKDIINILFKKERMQKNIKYIVSILFIVVIIFLIYVKYYYGKINSTYILTHFVICFNIILNTIGDLYYKIIEVTCTTDNIKIIIIGSIIIYIIKYIDLKSFLKDFLKNFLEPTNKFESSLFSFERQVAVMKEISDNEEKSIETLNLMSSSEDNSNEDIEKKIDISRKKMKLIQIITNDPSLLKILNMFIVEKKSKKKIPINIFKTYKTDNFKEIFEIKYEDGHAVLNGIKDDIKDLVNEIYLDISTRY